MLLRMRWMWEPVFPIGGSSMGMLAKDCPGPLVIATGDAASGTNARPRAPVGRVRAATVRA